MGFARARAWTVLSLTVGACSFDSGGGMGGASAEIGQSSQEGADDDDASEDTSGSATDPDGGPDDDASDSLDSAATEADSGETGHPAVLTFVEAPAYDFTLVPLGTTLAHVVTLHNTGGRTATGITAAIATPFAWNGGAWPGIGGTCVDTLAPDGYCQIELSFAPSTLGPVGGTIVVDYDDGDDPAQAVLSLTGAGSGATANLLLNGDGEDLGAPPPEWTPAAGTGWSTTTAIERSGARSITAGPSPYGEVVLVQPVAVAQWAELIDAGMLSITFDGWSRAYDNDNDPHRFRVDFVDADGAILQAFEGMSHTTASWVQSTDVRIAPAGTREVVVRLHCTKSIGTDCGGYYDDMSVTASYP